MNALAAETAWALSGDGAAAWPTIGSDFVVSAAPAVAGGEEPSSETAAAASTATRKTGNRD